MIKEHSGGKSAKRRIVIIDDHPIVRDGLSRLINHEPELEVCGAAASAGDGLDLVARLKPDLTIIDLSLGGRPGIELIKDIVVRFPGLLVLVLSMRDEKLYAQRCIRAGARGYIMKVEATEKVLSAIRRILSGERYVSESVAAGLLQQLARSGKPLVGSPVETLSDRELEIFKMIGQGMSVRKIADALFLSAKTVEAHREHIKQKLNVTSSSELLRYAVQTHLDAP